MPKSAPSGNLMENPDDPYVAVKMNRAPAKGVAIPAITVGTQAGFAVLATPAQKKDICNQFNVHCPVTGDDPPLPANITVGARPENQQDATTNFVDEDEEYLTFDANPAAADAAYVKAEVTAKAKADGTDGKDYRLRITGLAGGGTAAAPKRKVATVNLTATDLGMLTTPLAQTMAITVNVDPMPALSPDRTLPTAVTKKRLATGVVVVEDLSLFFMDDSTADDLATNANADGKSLEITAVVAKASDDPNGVVGTLVANTPLVPTSGTNEGDLVITPKNTGTVTITIRATETATGNAVVVGQYIERTITVTITE